MNKEEFLKKYGGVKVMFLSYFKYRFTYATDLDGKEITVVFTDPDGDIYRDAYTLFETIQECNLESWSIKDINV